MNQFIESVPVRRLLLVAGLLSFAALAQGCVIAAAGAGTAVAVTAAQDRPAKQAAIDENVDLSIRKALYKENENLGGRIGVSVVEGHVVLTGTVFNRDDRITAAKIAWGFKDVKDVQNEIQVGDPGGPVRYAKDAWITTRVRTAIIGDKNAKDVNYKVETVNGVVYLMGIARSQAELDGITDRASRIGGVKKVVCLVRLKDRGQETATN
jgi:osmotically-inducible protein OsmY